MLTLFPQASLARREHMFPHMVATPVTQNPTPPNDVDAAHQIELTILMGIRVAVTRHLCGEWDENTFLPWLMDNVYNQLLSPHMTN